MSKIAIFGAKKPKFGKNGTPDKFHLCNFGTGIGHFDMEATKISLIAAISLKLLLLLYKKYSLWPKLGPL